MKVDSKDSIIPRGINNYNQLHIFQTTNYLGWSGDPVYEMQGCLVDFWSKIYRNRLIDVIVCGGCHLTYIKHVLFTHIYNIYIYTCSIHLQPSSQASEVILQRSKSNTHQDSGSTSHHTCIICSIVWRQFSSFLKILWSQDLQSQLTAARPPVFFEIAVVAAQQSVLRYEDAAVRG